MYSVESVLNPFLLFSAVDSSSPPLLCGSIPLGRELVLLLNLAQGRENRPDRSREEKDGKQGIFIPDPFKIIRFTIRGEQRGDRGE